MDTHLKIYKVAERISDDVHFEAYFDLWRFSVGWINAICVGSASSASPLQQPSRRKEIR